MTKFKKIVSGTLAGCLMASALMMSAGAANVQTTVISKAGVQAAAQTAAQVRTAVKINPQSADIYAEGIPAAFLSEDGKTVLHGAELQRLDLHAAAHGWPLDGQNISWDSASRTVFLSGTTEKSYPCADDDAYHKRRRKNMSVRPARLRSIRA